MKRVKVHYKNLIDRKGREKVELTAFCPSKKVKVGGIACQKCKNFKGFCNWENLEVFCKI